MKKQLLLLLLVFGLAWVSTYAQKSPTLTYSAVTLQAEEHPQTEIDAKRLAVMLGYPYAIYHPDGIFFEAKAIESNLPVYTGIRNGYFPEHMGRTYFYHEILHSYDLTKARVHYSFDRVENPDLGFPTPVINANEAVSLLLVPNSTNSTVMAFNPENGDLVSMTYIPTADTFSTPIQARLSTSGTILVSDQVKDCIFEFDTLGVFTKVFAPQGGPNNTILDNIRGFNYRPNGNIVVCNAAGGNANSIVEFTSSGALVGVFIAPGTVLNSPFDIMFRQNDILVSASSSKCLHKYDLNGVYQSNLVAGLSFPQQMYELPDGRIVVAEFSGTSSGLQMYTATGSLIKLMTGATGVRGSYQLKNGNFLTTNGAGVYEIDSSTGASVRQIVSGVSARYISPFDLTVIPVELSSFTATGQHGVVELRWATATETNNKGFAIMRSRDNISFEQAGFVEGAGNSLAARFYSFTDKASGTGTWYYKLKQIDFNGTYSYSPLVQVEVGVPEEFTLDQNYPNPFNPTTTISFSLPEDADVSLTLHNTLGEKVADILNGKFSAGHHKTELNADNLSAGVYYYRLQAGTASAVKKLVLLK